MRGLAGCGGEGDRTRDACGRSSRMDLPFHSAIEDGGRQK